MKKILIIDDESLIRRTTAMLLEKVGMQAVLATGGQEGISLARSEKPDLILLDILMPDVSGWDVLDRLRSDQVLRQIPVVLFTAVDHAGTDRRAEESGVSATLRKPFHLQQLLSVINKSLGMA